MGARDGRRSKKKNGRYGSYDRYGRYGGYDALRNPSHVVRLDEQSKDPKRSPESPHPMSDVIVPSLVPWRTIIFANYLKCRRSL